jgi:hypothetical protein
MTAATLPQPDIEAHVWAQIGRPGVTSFCYAVTRDWAGWLVASFIQVDARARTKQAARDLAESVRQVIAGLPGTDWPEGVVSYVQAIEGPFWLPDPEDGAPRYCARYEIRTHPARSAPGARCSRPLPPGPSEG